MLPVTDNYSTLDCLRQCEVVQVLLWASPAMRGTRQRWQPRPTERQIHLLHDLTPARHVAECLLGARLQERVHALGLNKTGISSDHADAVVEAGAVAARAFRH